MQSIASAERIMINNINYDHHRQRICLLFHNINYNDQRKLLYVAPILTIKRYALHLSLLSSPSPSSMSGQTFVIISWLLLLLLFYKSDRELEQQQTLTLVKWWWKGEMKQLLFCFQSDFILSFHFQNCNSTSYAANRLQSTSIHNPHSLPYLTIYVYQLYIVHTYKYTCIIHNWEYVCA